MVKNHKIIKNGAKVKRRKDKSLSAQEPRELPAHKYFNLQMLIETTRLNSDKVYNNFKGLYNSFTDEEKKQIATALMRPTKEMFARLGMDISFSKLASDAS